MKSDGLHCEKSWHLSLSRSEKKHSTGRQKGSGSSFCFPREKSVRAWVNVTHRPQIYSSFMLFNAWNALNPFFSYFYNLFKSNLEVYFYRTLSKNNKGLEKLYFADLRSDALKLQAYMNGAWIVPADSLKCLQWLFKRRFGSFVLHSWLWIEFNLSVSRPRGHCRHVDGCFHTSRRNRSCRLAVNCPKTACAPK